MNCKHRKYIFHRQEILKTSPKASSGFSSRPRTRSIQRRRKWLKNNPPLTEPVSIYISPQRALNHWSYMGHGVVPGIGKEMPAEIPKAHYQLQIYFTLLGRGKYSWLDKPRRRLWSICSLLLGLKTQNCLIIKPELIQNLLKTSKRDE